MEACDGECAILGIPNNLHTLDKKSEAQFLRDELLHIRFPKPDGNEYSNAFMREFRCQNQSANRGKFSVPTDVLFNIKSDAHYFDTHLAVSIFVGEILDISCPNEGSILHDRNTKAVTKPADVYSCLLYTSDAADE